MNSNVTNNLNKLKFSLYILPLLLLVIIAILLYQNKAINALEYTNIQKDWFYYLNGKLSQFPQLQYNLTQLGDALIFLSILTFLIVKVPKIWQALVPSCLVSAILAKVLKEFFCVPRPAAILAHDTFTIVGEPHIGPTSSLPSGHAITVFTILTVLLFSYFPQKKFNQIVAVFCFITVGIFLVFTRVGVGAHFPLDVVIGGLIGYISGIFIQRRYNLFFWIGVKKFHPFFILLILVSLIIIIQKIFLNNIVIFYLVVFSLLYSLYLIILDYVKK